MAYPHLWHCKRCGSTPEISMVGKNILVRCTTCNSDKIDIRGDKIDVVAREWNKRNDPGKIGLIATIKKLFRKKESE
jgi:hypothetical protein